MYQAFGSLSSTQDFNQFYTMRGSQKEFKKLIATVGVEEMKRLESDEFYDKVEVNFADPAGRDKRVFLREIDYESRSDVNGIVLSVGDEVLHVYGKHLRRSIITMIFPLGERYSYRIVVTGLSGKSFPSSQCIRV